MQRVSISSEPHPPFPPGNPCSRRRIATKFQSHLSLIHLFHGDGTRRLSQIIKFQSHLSLIHLFHPNKVIQGNSYQEVSISSEPHPPFPPVHSRQIDKRVLEVSISSEPHPPFPQD